jgi:transposase
MALEWMDKNPADATGRAKVLTDAHSILLALILTGANRNDVTQLLPLIEAIPPIRGKRGRPLFKPSMRIRPRQVPQAPTRRSASPRRSPAGGQPHGSGLGKTRWVVERTIAWLHNFKRLRVRFERLARIHECLPACSIICWRHLINVMKVVLSELLSAYAGNASLARNALGATPWPRVNYAALAKRKSPGSPRSRHCRQPRPVRFIRGLGTKVSPRRRRKSVGRGHEAQ